MILHTTLWTDWYWIICFITKALNSICFTDHVCLNHCRYFIKCHSVDCHSFFRQIRDGCRRVVILYERISQFMVSQICGLWGLKLHSTNYIPCLAQFEQIIKIMIPIDINSLWPWDCIWRQRTSSTLAQVINSLLLNSTAPLPEPTLTPYQRTSAAPGANLLRYNIPALP